MTEVILIHSIWSFTVCVCTYVTYRSVEKWAAIKSAQTFMDCSERFGAILLKLMLAQNGKRPGTIHTRGTRERGDEQEY